ncbi:Putative triphosphatase YjbK [Streptococcus parasanguinis]|uniref:CYTH domain-containing protein n=1 Tax=Streptococcus parasanguinis TaxID=1318 RepID=UPI001960186F|nr:CYTH domain-containing protein [Streptococcus parasanguinis]VTY32030.1 Putative triphosphatase YjbK [Streptococcus parasanguinis]
MNHLEIEYKTLLDKEEYQSLLPLFADTKLVVQTNHYIDTPDQLIRKEKMALRVRTFTDQAELTLKVPEAVGHFEYNQDLSQEETEAILQHQQFADGEIKNLLISKEIPVEQLAVWGSLTTERFDKETNAGLVALDHSLYLDTEDYELEIEVETAEQEENFHKFIQDHGIVYKAAKNKIARLAERL